MIESEPSARPPHLNPQTTGGEVPQTEEHVVERLRSLPRAIGDNSWRAFAALDIATREEEDVLPARKGAQYVQIFRDRDTALDDGHVRFTARYYHLQIVTRTLSRRQKHVPGTISRDHVLQDGASPLR